MLSPLGPLRKGLKLALGRNTEGTKQMLKLRQRFFSSSVVERSAVNRLVVGSNPTWGDFIILVPSGAFMSTPDAGKGMLNNQ